MRSLTESGCIFLCDRATIPIRPEATIEAATAFSRVQVVTLPFGSVNVTLLRTPCKPQTGSDRSDPNVSARTILKALRHSPELYRLNMDNDGWVNSIEIGQLVNQLTGTDFVPDFDEVLRVFQEIDLIDRVQFQHRLFRATYGHSTEKFAPSTSAIPDQPLFHGTSSDNWSMIECFGLSPVKRRFVQLTTDFDYASQIANAHGRSPILLQVGTAVAVKLGVKFYSTDTHVWLATAIPATCLQVWLDDTIDLEEPLF